MKTENESLQPFLEEVKARNQRAKDAQNLRLSNMKYIESLKAMGVTLFFEVST